MYRCVDWKSTNTAYQCTAVPSSEDDQVRRQRG